MASPEGASPQARSSQKWNYSAFELFGELLSHEVFERAREAPANLDDQALATKIVDYR
jgi:hypothetical protein